MQKSGYSWPEMSKFSEKLNRYDKNRHIRTDYLNRKACPELDGIRSNHCLKPHTMHDTINSRSELVMKDLLKIVEYPVVISLCIALLLTTGTARAALDPFDKTKNVEIVSKAGSSPVTFAVEIGTGYLTGEATELVYWPEAGGHKASELTWKIDDLFMFNLGAEMEIRGWAKIRMDTWFQVTDGDGSLDDFDWQVIGADWTDWSHHEDTDVSEAYMFDISGEMPFYKTGNTAFSAIVGYKVDHFGWQVSGGDYIYSVSGFRDAQGSFPDNVLGISYEQTFYSLYLGLGTQFQFSRFRTGARIIYAPYVYGEATDHHHLRNLSTYQTFDEFGEGGLVAVDISGSYFFTDHLSLGLGLRYQSYSTMTGDADWHYLNEGRIIRNYDGAGIDQTSTMFVTTLKYTF